MNINEMSSSDAKETILMSEFTTIYDLYKVNLEVRRKKRTSGTFILPGKCLCSTKTWRVRGERKCEIPSESLAPQQVY